MGTEVSVSRPSAGTAVVHLPEWADAEDVRATIRPLIQRERRTSVAVDLSALATIDTHPLAVLVALSDYLKEHGGRLVLAAPGAELFPTLRSRGITRRVPTTLGRTLVMTRKVLPPFEQDAIPEGALVFAFTGATFGAVGPGEVAVVPDPALDQFVAVPQDAVAEADAV